MKETFIFYQSFYEAIKDLDDKIQLEIYQAISEYGLTRKTKKLSGISNTIFTLIKPQLEANWKRYENGKLGGKYGKLGGRPSNKKPQENPKQTPKEKEKEKEKEKVKVKDKENIKRKFGEYKHVLLTESEYNKLKKDFPDRYEFMIRNLDEYLEIKNVSYKNHYLVMRKWKSKETPKIEQNTPEWFNQDTKKQEASKEDLEEIDKMLSAYN